MIIIITTILVIKESNDMNDDNDNYVIITHLNGCTLTIRFLDNLSLVDTVADGGWSGRDRKV